MIAEALVIFACSKNVGCTETSNEYFRENPDFKAYIDKKTDTVRNFIGPAIVDKVGPVLFVFTGGSGTIRLDKHWTLQGNQSSGTLTWSMEL